MTDKTPDPQRRLTAIKELMREARSERNHTQASVNRILKSCRWLGLDRAETIGVLSFLDACNAEGAPWRAGRYEIKLPT